MTVRRVAASWAVVVLAVGAVATGGATVAAAAPAVRTPAAVPAESARVDYWVKVWGVAGDAPVVVRWGDGSSSRKTSACSVAAASRRPHSCTLRLSHAYPAKGTYKITITYGGRVISRQKAAIPFHAVGWRPPKGWTQPAGWLPYPDGATFAPCATVPWFYDAAAQPAASAGMKSDVVAALALLAAQTGLTFAETADRSAAQLVLDWADLRAEGGDVAGLGGFDRRSAFVHLSTTGRWPADTWAGFAIVTAPDGSTSVGRGWLVVHEVMHALGFDHVHDDTSVMNPVGGASALNAGDLDGLHTMYLNRPCGARS